MTGRHKLILPSERPYPFNLGNRQADKRFLTVWQTLSFQPRGKPADSNIPFHHQWPKMTSFLRHSLLKVPMRYTTRHRQKHVQPNRTTFPNLVPCHDEDLSKTTVLEKRNHADNLRRYFPKISIPSFSMLYHSGKNFNQIRLIFSDIWKLRKKGGGCP